MDYDLSQKQSCIKSMIRKRGIPKFTEGIEVSKLIPWHYIALYMIIYLFLVYCCLSGNSVIFVDYFPSEFHGTASARVVNIEYDSSETRIILKNSKIAPDNFAVTQYKYKVPKIGDEVDIVYKKHTYQCDKSLCVTSYINDRDAVRDALINCSPFIYTLIVPTVIIFLMSFYYWRKYSRFHFLEVNNFYVEVKSINKFDKVFDMSISESCYFKYCPLLIMEEYGFPAIIFQGPHMRNADFSEVMNTEFIFRTYLQSPDDLNNNKYYIKLIPKFERKIGFLEI